MASEGGVFAFASLPLVNERLPLLSHFGPKCFETGIGCEPDDNAWGRAHGLFAGWELRKRMLALGLSPYEPDPIAASAALQAVVDTAALRVDLLHRRLGQ